MINNKKYFLYSILLLTFLELLFFIGLAWGTIELLVKIMGVGEGLELVIYGIVAMYAALFGLLLSWLIYFLTIGKIYIKLGANFNFKHPVLFTSIIIFILGNILFYFAMLAWFAVK